MPVQPEAAAVAADEAAPHTEEAEEEWVEPGPVGEGREVGDP